MFVFFFFSSRRRHTRLQGDWSSDVCSSDLENRRGHHRVPGADPAVQRDARPARVAAEALVFSAAGARAAPRERRLPPRDAGPAESRLSGGHEADDGPLRHRGHRPGQHEVPHRRAELGPEEARGVAMMPLPRMRSEEQATPFTEERIQAEGQKDGERNIPEMGSYQPAPFEQALIAHGEQEVQRIYESASHRIAKLQPMFQALMRRLEDLDHRIQPIADRYKARVKELGRDVTIPFPSVLHWGVILFLGIGEFPLNTVVFRLFGEAEYLTYVMASTLAIIIPLIGVFIGVHVRHAIPKQIGNLLIGILTPAVVGATLYAVSLLRNTYIVSQFSGTGQVSAEGNQMAYALFALNALVFFAATVASYFAHDPDERLDGFHHSLRWLDRTKNEIRTKLYGVGTQLNGEIEQAKSQIEQIRALTNQRVQLYRQTNIRHRRLLPPPSFRKNAEFPTLHWWPEVSLNNNHHEGT